MRTNSPPAAHHDGPALRTLMYRYFFFAWLFKDVARGTQFERRAAWMHNVQQARWLPTYMRRYSVSGFLLVALGAVTEPLAPAWSAAFFVPGVMTVPMMAVAAIGYLGLKHWR